MKLIKRSTLLGMTIGLAALLLIYTFLRTFTPIKLDESGERFLMYGIIFAAFGIFVMNRKIVAEEKESAGKEQAKSEAEETRDVAASLETNESEKHSL